MSTKLLETLSTAKPLVFGAELGKTDENNKPYMGKIKYDSIPKFLQGFYQELLDTKKYANLLKALGNGLPIEDATKIILIVKMGRGEVNFMLFPLYVEPMMIILYYFATKANITPVIYDSQNDELTQEEIKLFMTGEV